MEKTLFIFSRAQVVVAAIAALLVAAVFQQTFGLLDATWHREEYSHGVLIPIISAFLLWQRRALFEQLPFKGSWTGFAVVVAGLAVYFLGSIASVRTIDAYALVVVIAGCVLAVMGWSAFRLALAPIALLLLMNPLPTFLYNNLSSQLQLISSQVGVAIIRLFGISVFLEGNVIDLGNYKLQVAEACSGLRYLFPLMTLGVIVACLFKGRAWMRWFIVLSTIPITALMNSFRIGVIGVLVDRYGTAQAEGFLHAFEGWIVFMACFALLFAEMWLLFRLSGDRRRFREMFALELPARRAKNAPVRARQLGKPALAVMVVLLLAVYPAMSSPQRVELKPERADFAEFPLQLAAWQGRRDRLDQVDLDALKLDDYILADYDRRGDGAGVQEAPGVNLYSAYYLSQHTEQSAHSPRSCLPGGGWRILKFDQRSVDGANLRGAPVRLNRAVIQKGASRELVYYWFQERGRDITSEFLVKWYLLADALTRNRSDGALVRLITPLSTGEEEAAGDARLTQFTRDLVPLLTKYVPD